MALTIALLKTPLSRGFCLFGAAGFMRVHLGPHRLFCGGGRGAVEGFEGLVRFFGGFLEQRIERGVLALGDRVLALEIVEHVPSGFVVLVDLGAADHLVVHGRDILDFLDAVHVADHVGIGLRRVCHRLQQVDGAVAEDVARGFYGFIIRQQFALGGAEQREDYGFFRPVGGVVDDALGRRDGLVVHEVLDALGPEEAHVLVEPVVADRGCDAEAVVVGESGFVEIERHLKILF